MTLSELLATEDYAALPDVEASALANRKRHPGNTYWSYRSLMSVGGIGIAATRRLIQSIDLAAVVDPVVSEIRWSLREGTGVNAGDLNTQAMLDTFAADEQLPLTAADVVAIKSLAENQRSDADLYGLGRVEEKHVRWARQ